MSVSDAVGLRDTPSGNNFYSAYGTTNLAPIILGNRLYN